MKLNLIMRAERQKGKEHERDKRYSHLFQKGLKLHGKGAGREDSPAALVPLSAQPGNTSATLILSGNVILTLVLLWLWRAL